VRISFHFADAPAPALIARLTDTQPILLRVCAWHTSDADLLALNRQYPGAVSHTMCEACALKFEQEVA